MCGFNRKRFGKWASKIWKVCFWLKMTYFDEKWLKIDNFFEWWSPDGPQICWSFRVSVGVFLGYVSNSSLGQLRLLQTNSGLFWTILDQHRLTIKYMQKMSHSYPLKGMKLSALGTSGDHLGPSGTIWGPSGDHLGTSGDHLGTSGDHLGTRTILGTIWGQ